MTAEPLRPALAIALACLLATSAHAHGQPGRVTRAARRAAVAVTAIAAVAVPQAASAKPTPDVGPSSTRVATAPAAASSASRERTAPRAQSRVLRERVRTGRAIAQGADPSIMSIASGPNAGHYLVTTGNLSVRYSRDLVHWRTVGTLFPGGRLPPGAVSDFWAPSLSTDGRRFFLRYTARGEGGMLRIRSAVATDVRGPYRDLGPTVPLAPGSPVGDIDPSELIDGVDGSRWLMWKRDGNAAGLATPMFIQQLGPRGEHLVGRRFTLATNDAAWEGISTEGPSGMRRGPRVYVSYAGRMYNTADYNVGMLRIWAPDGLRAALRAGRRFEKHDGPVGVSTSAHHEGMAHGDFVLDGELFVSHGWKRGEVGATPRETIARDVLWGADHWPRVVNGP